MIVYPQKQNIYIKKEDVIETVEKQRKYLLIVMSCLVIVSAIIAFTVHSKLIDTFKQFNQTIPFFTKYYQYISVGSSLILFIFVYTLSEKNTNKLEIERKLQRYKPQEMVNLAEVTNLNVESLIMLYLGVIVGLTIISIIQPIYSLTNSF